jgi:hypothetical protein
VKQWKTLDSRLLLDRSPRLQVYEETVELPHGQVIDSWTRVWLPAYVTVAAVTDDGLMVAARSRGSSCGTRFVARPARAGGGLGLGDRER